MCGGLVTFLRGCGQTDKISQMYAVLWSVFASYHWDCFCVLASRSSNRYIMCSIILYFWQKIWCCWEQPENDQAWPSCSWFLIRIKQRSISLSLPYLIKTPWSHGTDLVLIRLKNDALRWIVFNVIPFQVCRALGITLVCCYLKTDSTMEDN